MELLFDEVLTLDNLTELKEAIADEVKARKKNKNSLLDQFNGEYAEIERQINELVSLLPKTKHQRPILARLDQLEEERMEIVDKIAEEKSAVEPPIIHYSDATLATFLDTYKDGIESESIESKKAVLRSTIDHGVFDGETLTLHPSYQQITGVEMASPRGVEPLSSP